MSCQYCDYGCLILLFLFSISSLNTVLPKITTHQLSSLYMQAVVYIARRRNEANIVNLKGKLAKNKDYSVEMLSKFARKICFYSADFCLQSSSDIGSVCLALSIRLHWLFVEMAFTEPHQMRRTEEKKEKNTSKYSLHLATDAFWILTDAVWIICLACTQRQPRLSILTHQFLFSVWGRL